LPVSNVARILLELLKDHGPLCEPCLSYHVRMPISRVAGVLNRLRESVAVKIDNDQCLRCGEYVQTFALVKTREDVDVVTRTAPGSLRWRDDPVCPVCLKTIEPKHAVTVDHGEVVHADCWGKKPVRRDSIRRF
jgi:hypothetical protein